MAKVKVYSTPTCPWCIKAKDWFTENKIKFENFDVSEDEKARNEMVEKSGQMGVPVIIIDDTVIVGFDIDQIKEKLGM
ncbi:MAG: glutathione S-transferase N-terminal domain-containing protein [Nanoarchaeota archaeon]|nr:glutathione S-transferase N-terminal domain-containing protein [Nanoarchaeota archaeon]MBU1704142.1 glutathione S-transferase N-terminal domain-containing protein [Nanoarchaeota archaeon]